MEKANFTKVIGCKFFLIMALQKGYNADIPHRLYLTEEDAIEVANKHNREYNVKWVVKPIQFDEKIYLNCSKIISCIG